MTLHMPHEIIQFVNCYLLRDHQIIYEDLWIRNGVIVDPEKIFFDEKRIADKKINCNGALICPGFIDIQINGNLYALISFLRHLFLDIDCIIARMHWLFTKTIDMLIIFFIHRKKKLICRWVWHRFFSKCFHYFW